MVKVCAASPLLNSNMAQKQALRKLIMDSYSVTENY